MEGTPECCCLDGGEIISAAVLLHDVKNINLLSKSRWKTSILGYVMETFPCPAGALGGVGVGSCVVPARGSPCSEFCVCSQQGLRSVAQKHCTQLEEVTDKGHCCVKGELNYGLGVIYCAAGLLGAETNHGECPEWPSCSVTCVCTERMKFLHKTA